MRNDKDRMLERTYGLALITLVSAGCGHQIEDDSIQTDNLYDLAPDGTSQPPNAGDYSYPLVSARWTLPAIPVCWEEPGSPFLDQGRTWIRMKIASELERRTAVRFTGWGVCDANTSAGIRITNNAAEWPRTEGLGNQLNNMLNGMKLPLDYAMLPDFASCTASEQARRRCIEDLALHEFGHAIGLAHEQNRSDRPGSCTQSPQGGDGDTLIGEWDADSAMNYCNAIWNNGGRLSYGDQLGIEAMYGSAPLVHNELAGVVTLRSRNFPDRVIRHRAFLGEVEPLDAASADDATFIVVPGLANPSYVSLQSLNFPSRFLRHSAFRVQFDSNDGSQAFADDATFAPKLGLADGNQVSFESYNFPGLFIRHQDFHLIVAGVDTAQLGEDATFMINAPAASSTAYRFRSANISSNYVRHQNFWGELTPLANDVDRSDATFFLRTREIFHPFMGLESRALGNHFLRHSQFRLRLDSADGSDAFLYDSSFRVRPAINNNRRAVSFESRNFPNHFLRHRDSHLYVERGDNALFKNDASFLIERVAAP